jgi:NADP-dependent alcohol dehydrogenase
MNNFEFHNPVHLLFGKGMISKLNEQIPKDKKILITFGGGSVKRNGVYEQVKEALKDRDLTEFWGIESNPKVETLRDAIKLGKEKKVNFVLAVGGGSVLDGSKLIVGALTSDEDPWTLVRNGFVPSTIPLGAVLTIPATGSEMNNGGVISNKSTAEKFAFYGTFPQFSILDPTVTYSLPQHQLACGLCDTFVHVMEQYLTTPNQSKIMDRWAESILQTVIEIAPNVLKDHEDYQTRCDFMLSATMALNGFIAMGVSQDWATHMIGHELTALHGLAHAASLAIILPGTMRTLSKQKSAKILQYGQRIWGITEKEGDDETKIKIAIDKTEQFFRSLGLHTRLSEENIGEDTINEIARRFEERKAHFGEAANVDGNKAKEILNHCL